MECIENKEKSLISLTKRERQIVELIGHGLSQKEIAERLFIEKKTVDKHIENIKGKYGISKNTELVGLYVAMKKNKSFSLEKMRLYGLEAFFILINICPSDASIQH